MAPFRKIALVDVPRQEIRDGLCALLVNEGNLRSRTDRTNTLPESREVVSRLSQGTLGEYCIYPLDDSGLTPSFSIGRTAKADVVIADNRISALHARIEIEKDRAEFWLMDLSSTNGTFVDDVRLETGRAGRTRLPMGTRFVLGDTPIMLVDARGLARFLRAYSPTSSER